MARETKVGLIVGLGLILFVSIMVSEYFVESPAEDAVDAQAMSDFNQSTTNQTQLVRTTDGIAGEPVVSSPRDLAAAAFERHAGEYNPVTPQDPAVTEPPFQFEGPGFGEVPGETPIASAGIGGPPIDRVNVDDPSQASGNQLSLRDGPNVDPLAGISHVELPGLEEGQPTQVRHTVAAGENLSAIARRYYNGDGNMWYSIRDANPGLVGANGEIREGAVLVIPQRSNEEDDPTAQLSDRATGSDDGPGRTQVRIVTVQRGDTLSGLAAEHLGSATRWRMILDVNTDTMDDENDLREGMRLRIPTQQTVDVLEQAEDAMAGGEPENEPEAQPEQPTQRTYTVEGGDNLYRIAERTLGDGERYSEIFEANRDKLDSANDIQVGMVLVIPER